jgi:signal transduction histidine kinase
VSKRESSEIFELRARLRREEAKLEAVRDIAATLGSTLDLDSLLGVILSRITRVMEADRSTLYLYDEDRRQLWSKVLQGEDVREIRLPLGEGVAGWVAREGRSLTIDDAYSDPRFDPDWDRITGYRTRTILCAPMKNHQGKTIGVVQVLNKADGPFTSEDEALLVALASQAAVCIENSKLYLSVVGKNLELLDTQTRLERKVRDLDLLVEIAKEMSRAGGLDPMLSAVTAKALQMCDADSGAVLIVEGEEGVVTFRGTNDDGEVHRVKIPLSEGLLGWVAKNGEPVLSNEVGRDSRHSTLSAKAVGRRIRSFLGVPLVGSGSCFGALAVWNKTRGRGGFSQDDLKLLSLVAGDVASNLELARAREASIREDRLATIGRLLSGVVHDLRTPITVINGYVQLMAAAGEQAQRQEYAQIALQQFEHIQSMTAELLAFAKGERTVLVRRVYLQKFLDEMKGYVTKIFEGKSVEVVFRDKDRGSAMIDESKMRRVFQNIAKNALDAMPDGGRFTVETARDGDAVVFRFKDTGGGIPAAIRDRLFESFVTSGKRDGTGLGLAIVKKIVDEHGGTISFETSEKGTTFAVRVPQEPASARRAPNEATREADRSPPDAPR